MENLLDDYYEFIGVARSASEDDIKQACNKLLFKYHPDKCKEDFATGITQHVNKIKAILMDQNKRAEYDKTLLISSPQSTPKPKSKPTVKEEMPDLAEYTQVKYGDLSPWAKKQYKKFKASDAPGYKMFAGSSYKYVVVNAGNGYRIYKKRESVFDTKYSY